MRSIFFTDQTILVCMYHKICIIICSSCQKKVDISIFFREIFFHDFENILNCLSLSKLTWWIVRSLKSCWRFLSKTSPTMTSLGTISRSRKNSDKTLAMSVNELWNEKIENNFFFKTYESRICAIYIQWDINNNKCTSRLFWTRIFV